MVSGTLNKNEVLLTFFLDRPLSVSTRRDRELRMRGGLSSWEEFRGELLFILGELLGMGELSGMGESVSCSESLETCVATVSLLWTDI